MVSKAYDWNGGAELDEHTKRKHKVLREYFREYLVTRCQVRHQERFRLAVIDGFAGAGRYKCGTAGSPLIFLETLDQAAREINVHRAAEGARPIQIECFAMFNDADVTAIAALRTHTAGLLEGIRAENQHLHIQVEYFEDDFETLYPRIKSFLSEGRYQNVLFNLDQYGYSKVNPVLLNDIMGTWASAEIFLTFAIKTLLTYFPTDEAKNRLLADQPELKKEIYAFLHDGGTTINKREWLGVAEQIVYDQLKLVAPFVSTFSIHNPDGWRYWLIHFANRARARQVYNDILHENSTSQAHFGRSGLNMLSFNPAEEGMLYLFTDEAREQAIKQLHEDIPNTILEHGDSLGVEEFHLSVYKETPAHSRDIHQVLIDNDDLEVLTPTGGERRTAHTIKTGDTIRLKRQRSFFPMFPKKS
ncbi:MAG: three-Cys-motif partner protein TcmP [Alphaproteobacteria bacterium]|nr:three-Cys-motif partner protein TcmP [Alphaproteobacteria bacterium]QQS56382.1 MAG: three-Cys-motif partner protein TcmP [Alphaproteobacteria bacterium]